MAKLSRKDRYVLNRCAHALRAIEDYSRTHVEFAGALSRIPVPNGDPLIHFANQLAELAGRLAPEAEG